ncbi:MAG TPA: GNAT family N-acetyltransferase [Ignavibacteria bacterium]
MEYPSGKGLGLPAEVSAQAGGGNINILYRKIIPEDNPALYKIITQVMTEFGANSKTTVLGDPSIRKMSENYAEPDSVYYVALVENKIAGGAGIKQLDGATEKICELQRMFLLPDARGKGIGKRLLEMCLEDAKNFGYESCYLESLSNMLDARRLYEKFGFKIIDAPMGNTGHSGCNVFMLKKLI